MATGLTPLLNSLIATNMIDLWLSPRSGALYDRLTATRLLAGNDATSILRRNGFDIPYGKYGTVTVLNSMTTEGSCFIRTRIDRSAAGLYIMSDFDSGLSKGFALNPSATTTLRVAVYTSGGQKTVIGGANSVVYGDFKVYGLTFKNNGNLRAFFNGAQTGADTSLAGVTYIPTDTVLNVSRRQGASSTIAQLVSDIIIVKRELSVAEAATLTDELNNQIQYETQSMICNHLFPTLGGDVYRACYGILAGETTMSAGQSLGQLDALKVSTGTHKMNTFLYNGQLAKGIKCVTAGNIVLPDPRPTLGTTWAYRYYDDSAATWESRTSATATVALDAANDIILWSTADNNTALRKY